MDQKTSHYGQLFLTLGINFKTPNNAGMHSQIVFFLSARFNNLQILDSHSVTSCSGFEQLFCENLKPATTWYSRIHIKAYFQNHYST